MQMQLCELFELFEYRRNRMLLFFSLLYATVVVLSWCLLSGVWGC